MGTLGQISLVVRAGLLWITGALWFAKWQLQKSGSVVVLTLHRVLTTEDASATCSLEGIVISQTLFRGLCRYLVTNCQVVPILGAEAGNVEAKLKVALTFDDGWRDNYTTALPILQEYRLPSTIFICPGLAGKTLPFWPERMVGMLRAQPEAKTGREIEIEIESWKHRAHDEREQFLEQLAKTAIKGPQESPEQPDSLMNWQETAEMAAQGVHFGSHTYRHEILTTIPVQAASRELIQSKAEIEKALEITCDTLAYPNGDWSPAVWAATKSAGYSLAFSTQRGAWTGQTDQLAIPRANIYDGNVKGAFGGFSQAVLEYTTFWKSWRAMPVGRQDRETVGVRETKREYIA